MGALYVQCLKLLRTNLLKGERSICSSLKAIESQYDLSYTRESHSKQFYWQVCQNIALHHAYLLSAELCFFMGCVPGGKYPQHNQRSTGRSVENSGTVKFFFLYCEISTGFTGSDKKRCKQCCEFKKLKLILQLKDKP